MTFIAPTSHIRSHSGVIRPFAATTKGIRGFGRIRRADEDSARLAMGVDPHLPTAMLTGSSIEHLARIALG